MRGTAVARAEAATGYADIASQRGKAPNRSSALPSVAALVHGAAAEDEHRRLGRSIPPRESDDPLGRDTGDARRPLGRVHFDVRRERVETDGVAGDKLGIV